jgi:hypothetical protein
MAAAAAAAEGVRPERRKGREGLALSRTLRTGNELRRRRRSKRRETLELCRSSWADGPM